MVSSLRDRYLEDGFIHIRSIFDRKEVDSAIRSVEFLPDRARQASGNRNIQRVQPLRSGPSVAYPAWIKTFYDNARLDRSIRAIFEGDIVPTPKMSRDRQLTGLLIEPLDNWWSTGLHRDYRDFLDGVIDMEAWRAKTADPRFFNQINIPLLSDTNLWVIPGSHRRSDLENEARLVHERTRYRKLQDGPVPRAEVDACRNALNTGLEACGAVNILASPGDLILYRSNMLHCGVYQPGVRRLTLHDAVYSAQWHKYAMEVVSKVQLARSLFTVTAGG